MEVGWEHEEQPDEKQNLTKEYRIAGDAKGADVDDLAELARRRADPLRSAHVVLL